MFHGRHAASRVRSIERVSQPFPFQRDDESLFAVEIPQNGIGKLATDLDATFPSGRKSGLASTGIIGAGNLFEICRNHGMSAA